MPPAGQTNPETDFFNAIFDAGRPARRPGDFRTLHAGEAGQACGVKHWLQFAMVLVTLTLHTAPARATFTSLYAFGDGVCTTTNSPGGAQFYGNRFSNGRVWVEVLAQRQGVNYEANKNWSYFGHDSTALLHNLTNFVAPADLATALCIVWANDADYVYNISNLSPYTTNNLAAWTNAMNRSLSNHFTAVQMLYAKGVRTLVMPNVVDLTKVPFFVNTPAPDKAFIRQRIRDYNSAFTARMNQARGIYPALNLQLPDVYSLLDDIIVRPAVYGVTNALYQGQSIDALSDPALSDKSLNGPGRNYIFWEYLDPTAKVHAVLADYVHNLIAPPVLAAVGVTGANAEWQLSQLPVGLSGFLEGTTNFGQWSVATNISSTASVQRVSLPLTGSWQAYRLRFPFAWNWP